MKSVREELVAALEALDKKQATCVHKWGEPVDDVFEKKVEVINPTRANFYNTEVVRIDKIPCRSVTCTECYKKIYLLNNEEINLSTGKSK